MSNGPSPPYYGGVDPRSGNPNNNMSGSDNFVGGASNASGSTSGFGGTMGGHAYGAEYRPQFGQPQYSAGMPSSVEYTSGGGGGGGMPNYSTTPFLQQQQQQIPEANPPSSTGFPSRQGPSMVPSSPGYAQTPSFPPGAPGGGYPPGTGSITRFAPATNAGVPTNAGSATLGGSGQGGQMHPTASSSPYNFQSPSQPGNMGTTGGSNTNTNQASISFAQRGAMLQQQKEQSVYGGPTTGLPQQQQSQPQLGYGGLPQPGRGIATPNTPTPPPSQQQQRQQVPQQPPPNMAGMSFAQRSALMRQGQPQAQPSLASSTSNFYGGGSVVSQLPYQTVNTPTIQTPSPQAPPSNVYSPQRPQAPQLQQQKQPPQQQQPPAMYGQGGPPGTPSMMAQQGSGSVISYPQQQQQPGQYYQGGSMPGTTMPQAQDQQQQQFQQQMPPQQQPGMMSQQQMMQSSMMSPPPMANSTVPMNNNVPVNQNLNKNMNIYIDPPEVIAQQNRLLTDATRKVQEHAYYMKQAMERHDLPTVLDRAAQMVGELGEHAHSHHHHHLHPPAPGATGTTTALSPKNYYELHLRALEELPTLEDYLLGVATQRGPSVPPMQAGMMVPPPNMGAAMQTPYQNMMYGGMPPGSDPMMAPVLSQQLQQPQMYGGAPLPTPEPACTMRELYDYVQYCPNVLSRLYLQICAASALIRSGEVGTRWVLKDIIEAVKCVQNPVRGLFLRHYLLQALRDKLPNEPILPTQVIPYGMSSPPVLSSGTTTESTTSNGEETGQSMTQVDNGTVKDSYEFILANFIQMNKLWVRIKHLPGDGKSKDIRRRREKDRNELRILVGTNLVRLSALDSVTSQIYGQVILPTVLDHIIISEDPLAQAYLIDCIVQVFPDEYHIETMPILLAACPKLRDKVNVRTILHSLMERLANYLADEELLDEADSNQVKRQMAQDSFRMMDECVQSVYNARGPKLQAKEVIRLQTALLTFSMKCYRGNLEQITLCLDNCVVALQQARANQALMQEARNQHLDPNIPRILPQLEAVATQELEKLLSIPLDELALGVLTLDHYADLIGFLPWANRRQVALTMLEAVSKAGKSPSSMKEIEELFSVIAPVLRDEYENVRGQTYHQQQQQQLMLQQQQQQQNQYMQRTTDLMAGLGVSYQQPFGQASATMPFPEDPQYRKDAALVSKLIHLLYHEDTDMHFAMLEVARNHLNGGRIQRTESPFTALVFAALTLAKRIVREAVTSGSDDTAKESFVNVASEEEKTEHVGANEGEEVKEGSLFEETEPSLATDAVPTQNGKGEKQVT